MAKDDQIIKVLKRRGEKRVINDVDRGIFDAGSKSGRQDMKVEVLTMLQELYLADDAPARGTPEAQAILNVAADISQKLQA